MADPTPNRPPLWRVMHDAFLSSDLSGPHGHLIAQGFAREIRALRDWLVPEEDPEPNEFAGYGIGSDCQEFTDQWARWHNDQRLRAILTAEADRAERGDVGMRPPADETTTTEEPC